MLKLPNSLEAWGTPGFETALKEEIQKLDYGMLPLQEGLDADDTLHEESLRDKIRTEIVQASRANEEAVGVETLRMFEKQVMLQVLDTLWK